MSTEMLDADALGPHTKAAGRRYSVRQIAAFEAGAPIFRAAAAALGEAHPAVLAIRDGLVAVAQGCHRYDDVDKLDGYRAAREHASRAVALALLAGGDGGTAVADAIERDLIPALNRHIREVAHVDEGRMLALTRQLDELVRQLGGLTRPPDRGGGF